jgi:hypothetical protein
MTEIVQDLKNLFQKLDHLEAENRDLRDGLFEIQKDRDHAKALCRRAEEKVRILEQTNAVTGLDAVDEAWLFEHQAVLKFRRRFGGGRQLLVTVDGRTAAREHIDEQTQILPIVMEEISGRKRATPKKQGQKAN